jgi:hypothetical protein
MSFPAALVFLFQPLQCVALILTAAEINHTNPAYSACPVCASIQVSDGMCRPNEPTRRRKAIEKEEEEGKSRKKGEQGGYSHLVQFRERGLYVSLMLGGHHGVALQHSVLHGERLSGGRRYLYQRKRIKGAVSINAYESSVRSLRHSSAPTAPWGPHRVQNCPP